MIARLLQIHALLCDEARTLTEAKNFDYGSSSNLFKNLKLCESMGLATTEEGILIRLTDKLSRLGSFVEKGTLKNESYRDTIIDIINYCVLFHAWVLMKEDHGA